MNVCAAARRSRGPPSPCSDGRRCAMLERAATPIQSHLIECIGGSFILSGADSKRVITEKITMIFLKLEISREIC